MCLTSIEELVARSAKAPPDLVRFFLRHRLDRFPLLLQRLDELGGLLPVARVDQRLDARGELLLLHQVGAALLVEDGEGGARALVHLIGGGLEALPSCSCFSFVVGPAAFQSTCSCLSAVAAFGRLVSSSSASALAQSASSLGTLAQRFQSSASWSSLTRARSLSRAACQRAFSGAASRPRGPSASNACCARLMASLARLTSSAVTASSAGQRRQPPGWPSLLRRDARALPPFGVALLALAKEEERKRRDAEKAEARARRDAEEKANLERLTTLANELEAVTTDDPKRGADAIKRAQQAFDALGPLSRDAAGEKARWQAARDKLRARVSELYEADEWKRWANVPKLEALCAKAEALLEETDLPKAAAALKTLHVEWKAVGFTSKEKQEALWQRFKTAADQVHERSRAHFAVLDEQRGANLAKKEELAARVEALADSSDWKETAELIKALQEEWKALGPVPKEKGDEVWKRFRGACDRFFDRRKAHFEAGDAERSANLSKLETLIASVERLAASTDWKRTGDEIKALQAEWKTVGPAPRDKSEDAWKRFRAACDRFFDARKIHFDKLDEERGANLKAKELLCEKVEALGDAPPDGGDRGRQGAAGRVAHRRPRAEGRRRRRVESLPRRLRQDLTIACAAPRRRRRPHRPQRRQTSPPPPAGQRRSWATSWPTSSRSSARNTVRWQRVSSVHSDEQSSVSRSPRATDCASHAILLRASGACISSR